MKNLLTSEMIFLSNFSLNFLNFFLAFFTYFFVYSNSFIFSFVMLQSKSFFRLFLGKIENINLERKTRIGRHDDFMSNGKTSFSLKKGTVKGMMMTTRKISLEISKCNVVSERTKKSSTMRKNLILIRFTFSYRCYFIKPVPDWILFN